MEIMDNSLEIARLKNHNLDMILILLKAHDIVKELNKDKFSGFYLTFYGSTLSVDSSGTAIWHSLRDNIKDLNIKEIKLRVANKVYVDYY